MDRLAAGVLIFRGGDPGHPLEGGGEIGDVLIAHLLSDLIDLGAAVPQQLHGLMDAAAGEIVEQGVVRLPLEDVAQMALADAKVLGNRGHADAGVVVVCADIVTGLQDIAALVPLL